MAVVVKGQFNMPPGSPPYSKKMKQLEDPRGFSMQGGKQKRKGLGGGGKTGHVDAQVPWDQAPLLIVEHLKL